MISAGFTPFCGSGSVLIDGDIGPTHSVDIDVSDRDQVRRFFVWDRDNGTVTLQFSTSDLFDVSYVEIYSLIIPSDRIGSSVTTSFGTDMDGTVVISNTQSCLSSSSINTLSRITYIHCVTD